MTKVFRSFRFNPQLYAEFTAIARNSHSTITDALEKFMQSGVDAQKLVYVEQGSANVDSEAQVLLDWLIKGKRFYRSKNGEEENVQGRLFEMITKVRNPALLAEIKEALKNSAT